jgi:hypothetical protein
MEGAKPELGEPKGSLGWQVGLLTNKIRPKPKKIKLEKINNKPLTVLSREGYHI